jgi:hypothetical protein
MIHEIEQEVFLVKRIDQIATRIKETKDSDRLYDFLDDLNKEWPIIKGGEGSCRLPYNISYCTNEIDTKVNIEKLEIFSL